MGEELGNEDGVNSSTNLLSSMPSTRVDRLLQERIRRNRSHQQFDYDEAQYDGPLPGDTEPGCIERLVVVANRLPVTCIKDANGEWQLQVSAGGLVSALKGVTTYRTVWIGWPGIWVKPGKDRDALAALLMEEGCVPVWVEPTLLDMYYNGFCNSVLWQLFHYVPLNIDAWLKMSEHRAMQMQWQAYQVANQKFADVVLENYEPADIMWVQDYHLMLLPSLLKAVVPKMKVGFFLHTPFPSSEMYRTLPVREEVLRAVLGADLIGFHTYDYARHFISSCTRILGLEGTPEGVENNGTITRVGTFPIGIDPERFTRALETDEVKSHVAKLLNKYAGRKIMLGVDRLDMVKGIPQKLLAFEKFLEEHPEWRDKVLLVQIAVPSRTDVPEYQKLRSQVHEIVGRINGQYGTLTYVPIYHLDTSLSFTELCALYAVTDVALVTSLRDGMNLVSYEYVACQSDNAGVLVLSEFAGAAQSLGAGAILVNPWNINDMAQAIEDALCMSEEERRERHKQNYMHVQTHTAQNWADTFISELNDTHIEADLRMRHAPPPLEIQEAVTAYQYSKCRLIVLGYNATLTTHIEAVPGRAGNAATKRQHDLLKALAKPNPKVLSSIQELCQDPCNLVVIFSGSETGKLEEIFGDLPVWLAAENGVFVRPPPQHMLPTQRTSQRGNRHHHKDGHDYSWIQLFDGIHREWMESVQLVFDYFCERTPRSFVEARETSLVWNYKHADVEFGRIQARDLLQHLWTGPISNAPVEIIQGGKSVEVRPVGVTKGTAMQRMVQLMSEIYGYDRVGFDFVLCIGHLLARDENMYSFFEGARVDGSGASAHGGRSERGTGTQPAVSAQQPQMNLHQRAQLQMQQQAAAMGVSPHLHLAANRGGMQQPPYVNGNTLGPGIAPGGGITGLGPTGPMPRAAASANAGGPVMSQQYQYQQQHYAAQQAQHPELYARLQAAAAARAASAQSEIVVTTVSRGPSLNQPMSPSAGLPHASSLSQQQPGSMGSSGGTLPPSVSQQASPAGRPGGAVQDQMRPVNSGVLSRKSSERMIGRTASNVVSPGHAAQQQGQLPLQRDNSDLSRYDSGTGSLTGSWNMQYQPRQVHSDEKPVIDHAGRQSTNPAHSGKLPQQQQQSQQQQQQQQSSQQSKPSGLAIPQSLSVNVSSPPGVSSHPISATSSSHHPQQRTANSMQQAAAAQRPNGVQAAASPARQASYTPLHAHNSAGVTSGTADAAAALPRPRSAPPIPPPIDASPRSECAETITFEPGPPLSSVHSCTSTHSQMHQQQQQIQQQIQQQRQDKYAGVPNGHMSSSPSPNPAGTSPTTHVQRGFTIPPPSPSTSSHSGRARHARHNSTGASPGHMGLGQAVSSYLQSNGPRESRAIMFNFPPKYLYTCTVGRNRSKARFALSTATDVADLLDSIVQQAIFHRDPPSLTHPRDLHIPHAMSMSRVDSYSSTEPLSPDSMLTLMSNWKAYRVSGALQGGGSASSIPDLVAMSMQSGPMQVAGGSGSVTGLQSHGSQPALLVPGSAQRRSRTGVPTLASYSGNGMDAAGSVAQSPSLGHLSSMQCIPDRGVTMTTSSSGSALNTFMMPENSVLGSQRSILGVGSLVQESVPEDPAQEDLLSLENNLHDAFMRQANIWKSSSDVQGRMRHVESSMLVNDLDVGPSVSQQGTPSPPGSANVVATPATPQAGHVNPNDSNPHERASQGW